MAVAILARLELERAASDYCCEDSEQLHANRDRLRGGSIVPRIAIEYLDCLDVLVALDRQSAYTSSQEESLWSCWTLLERRKRQD